MWIVTGGAGFIGSNLIQACNGRGHTEILVVDRRNENFENLNDLRFADFMQPEEFLQALGRNALPGRIEAILHQGACADTTCTDERFMMENNVSFSKAVLHFAIKKRSRSEEHTSELQSHLNLVCRLLLEKKKTAEPPRTT